MNPKIILKARWVSGMGRQRGLREWAGDVELQGGLVPVILSAEVRVEREVIDLTGWVKEIKKKQINNILIGSENKKLIIFLALNYSAQLYGCALKQWR